ncbi:hypothetical protein RJD38_18970 [Vibrio scophthalmi]|uniref:Uncharacterized protein n=1 Tax=Vibrio scophthalmi TaxID=45658 RepID=A0A1C7FEE2_9VIBR|nr:hypothetical protein [Vibrio scophthalmi]ANU38291.1 hypothetical protein VSVS05_03253 [Vibrio scophthalmi]
MIFKFKGQWLKVELDDDEKALFHNNSGYLKKRCDGLLIKPEFFNESKSVKDTYRYILSYQKSNWQLIKPSRTPISRDFENFEVQQKTNNIVVLLESPHREEFTDDYNPIAPACGTTGLYFQQYFSSHVLPLLQGLGLTLDQDMEYAIILVNPVPFQTSLVAIHGSKKLQKPLRDKVWKVLYQQCASEFKCRLESYEPKVIINACTSKLKTELNGVLSDFDVQKFSTSHPSQWFQLKPFERT